MKRNVIIISIGILLVALLGSAYFFFSEKNKSDSDFANVSENGVQFQYPKTLIHQSHGPTVSTSHYAIDSIVATSTESANNTSNIEIAIPVAEAPGEGVSLSEKQKDFTKEVMDVPPQIEYLTINGHAAEKMVIDSSKIKGNSSEVKNNVTTFVVLESKYPNTTITLAYTRYEGDSSLDQAWRMILDTLKY